MFNVSVLVMHGWDIPVQCATNQHYGHPTTLPRLFCIRQFKSRRSSVKLYLQCSNLEPLYWSFCLTFELFDFLSSSLLGSVLITLIFNLDWTALWTATRSKFIKSEWCLYLVDCLYQQTKQAQAKVLIQSWYCSCRKTVWTTEQNKSSDTFVCITCFI